MDQDRRMFLESSLRADFVSETQGLSVLDRLKWLFARLDEYLDRWISFCLRDDITVAGHIQSDLHGMLLIGIDVIDQEMKGVVGCERLQQEWREFTREVRALDDKSDKNVVDMLKRTFENALSELSSSCRDQT